MCIACSCACCTLPLFEGCGCTDCEEEACWPPDDEDDDPGWAAEERAERDYHAWDQPFAISPEALEEIRGAERAAGVE